MEETFLHATYTQSTSRKKCTKSKLGFGTNPNDANAIAREAIGDETSIVPNPTNDALFLKKVS
jgi:hypothetical protein